MSRPSRNSLEKYLRTVVAMVQSVTVVVAVTVGLAIAGAITWGVLEWMRNYPASVQVVPDFFHVRTDYEPPPVIASSALDEFALKIMNWYNMTFLGATRFGSGLGAIAGGLWSLSMVRSFPKPARLAAGLVGGALIGSRLAQILGPFPKTFIASIICGGIAGATIMALMPAQDRIPPLPDDEPAAPALPDSALS